MDRALSGNCNDQIAADAFGCITHYPQSDLAEMLKCSAVFATMWKVRTNEPRWMDGLHQLCDAGVKVVLFQESETGWPLAQPWDDQKSFFELLGKVDLFLTHNDHDVEMWAPFRKGKPIRRWVTCLDLETIKRFRIEPQQKPTKPILFGSSFDDRTNGLAGLVACMGLGRPLIHQNRTEGWDYRNTDMKAILGIEWTEIPQCGWHDWLREAAKAYIVVHPMLAAAGRDQIAFAAMGIPCIGNEELSIQKELFPDLTTDRWDVESMRKDVRMLLADNLSYSFVRRKAMEEVRNYGLDRAVVQAKKLKEAMRWT